MLTELIVNAAVFDESSGSLNVSTSPTAYPSPLSTMCIVAVVPVLPEITRLKVLNNRTKNAGGGLNYLMGL